MSDQPLPFVRPSAPEIREREDLPIGAYPRIRLRRNRAHDWSRRLNAENVLTVNDLIWPVFVHDQADPVDVPSMPGMKRHSVSSLVDAVGEAGELGVPLVAVFPAIDPARKDEEGSEALNPEKIGRAHV